MGTFGMIVMFIICLIFIIICSRNIVQSAIEKKEKNQEKTDLYIKNKENYETWEKHYLNFKNEVSGYYNQEISKVIYSNGLVIENKKFGFSQKICISPNNDEILVYDDFDLENQDSEIVSNVKQRIISNHLYDKNGNLKYYMPQRYKIDSINFFKKDGNIETLTNISGGGFSLDGAIVGGLIAGEAGAIIGSRKEITTNHETKDTRTTTISFNNISFECGGFDLFEYLMEFIPQKEYNYYITKKRNEIEKNKNEVI